MIDNSKTKEAISDAKAPGTSVDGNARASTIDNEVVNAKASDNGISRAIVSMDNLGIIASVLCLVHCLAMPFLIAILPFLGLQFLDSHESHMWLGSIIIAFALFAIVPGYLKHKRKRILGGMLVGVSMVSVGAYFSHSFHAMAIELPLVISGNLILVGTHLVNMRQVRKLRAGKGSGSGSEDNANAAKVGGSGHSCCDHDH